MATDYDAPRNPPEEGPSVDALVAARTPGALITRPPLIDESEADESADLPEVDLSEIGLVVHVIPQQDDEFLCESCFLVCHRSQLAEGPDDRQWCQSCQD